MDEHSNVAKGAPGSVFPLRSWRAGLLFCLAGGIGLAGWANCLPPERVDPNQFIEISDGISVDIYSGGRLTHRIESVRGLMHEDSQIVWLEGPRVKIFEDGVVAREVTGQSGRVWPVDVAVPKEDGTSEKVTKFDWSICGGVQFHSANGQKIETPELIFDNESRTIRGEKGVEYRIPAGEQGGFLYGGASGFQFGISDATGGFGEWNLIGPGELKFEKGDK